jgi:AcrR family transcriptional regulator
MTDKRESHKVPPISATNQRGSETSHGVLAELQRKRILQAMIELSNERGFGEVTVGQLVERAEVSRRTFHTHFTDLQDCLIGVLDQAADIGNELALRALDGEESWQDGIRSALAALLLFVDREPDLGRAALIETLTAGPRVLKHREKRAAELLALITNLDRWPGAEGVELPPLSPEGSFGAVFRIVENHLVARDPEPLIDKLGPLMGFVVAPYLGRHAAIREIERGQELATNLHSENSRSGSIGAALGDDEKMLASLHHPRAHRARRCILYLAENPGSSNRQVAREIEVGHQGQVSKLLARLEHMGLLRKSPGAPGRPNAWWLTKKGEGVARSLFESSSKG